MTEPLLLALLTLFAAGIGTATGFGTSTIMMPIMVMFVPVPIALLFVGIIHLCGDLWKILLFRSGLDWKLFLAFGLPGIAASYLGASLAMEAQALPLERMVGGFLVLYVLFIWFRQEWALPKNSRTAVTGGVLSGLCAGFFGVGGAVRSAFLLAFDLPKAVYICTSGLIALVIDITRVSRYLWGGTALHGNLLAALLICIPVSLLGAYLAKRFLDRLPQAGFRLFIALFLALAGLKLMVWPGVQ